MNDWQVVIEVWPHSTGNGQTADQEAAGPRSRGFKVRADNADEALRGACLIAEGIESHPMVWRANVRALVMQGWGKAS